MAGPRIVNTLWPNWQDENFKESQTGWTTIDQLAEPVGVYSALLDAAIDIASPGMKNATFQRKMDITSSTGTGPYGSVRDQVVFQMESENYTRLIALPGPAESIFIPGSVKVDMGNAMVLAFLSQVTTVLGDSYGSPWLRCAAAWRRRVRIGGSD